MTLTTVIFIVSYISHCTCFNAALILSCLSIGMGRNYCLMSLYDHEELDGHFAFGLFLRSSRLVYGQERILKFYI